MNNEIKEILDKLLKYFKESNINDFGYEQDKLISYEEAQILLDYITNLQQENERLKENKSTPDELANLLNQELIEQRADYKSKIDKALHRIQLIQMDGEVSIRDLGLIVRDLIGGDKE